MNTLEVRQSHANDIEQIRRIYAEPSNYAATLQLPFPSPELCEKWLALRRIELEVYTDNVAAIGLYQKFGFTIEGTLKQYAFRNGAFVDVHVMSRVCA